MDGKKAVKMAAMKAARFLLVLVRKRSLPDRQL